MTDRQSPAEEGSSLPARVWIVANPTSGKGRGERWLAEAQRRLDQKGVAHEVLLTRGPGEAEKASHDLPDDVDAVWVIGGDGTINEVIQGIAGRRATLSILPAGTGNVVARELGIPRKLDPSIDWAMSGPKTELDLGTANDRRFLFMVSAGFDASIVAHIASKRTGTMHLWDYLPAIWQCRRVPEERFHVEVDGEPIGGVTWSAIFNVQRYAGILKVCPEARIDSRDLALLTLRDPVTDRLGQVLWAAARSRLHRLPDAEIRTFQNASLDGVGDVQMDGDLFASTGRVDLSVIPRGITLRGPPASHWP